MQMLAHPASATGFIQTFFLAIPVSCGYQIQWEYYTRLP